MPKPGLTVKQEQFCLAVLKGMSQADAYRSVYNARKMTPEAVQVEAARLMKNPKVTLRVEALRAVAVEKGLMDRQEWLEHLQKMARADPREMYDSFGNPKEIVELEDNEAAAIAGFEFFEEFQGKGEARQAVGVTKKFKLLGRTKPLEIIEKAQGYYREADADTVPQSQSVQIVFVDSSRRPAQSSQTVNPLPPGVSLVSGD